MAIPESQLDTWSHQGAMQGSCDTYNTVKAALESSSAVYKDQKFEVFLQGSYGNDTNIFAESDVDTVMRLNSIWRSDLSQLPEDQQAAYHATFGNATYTFGEFERGVVLRLETAFGKESVDAGNKAIKIKANGSRRSADVVACYQYRKYVRFIDEDDQDYLPGIIFPTDSSGEVINYPKLHSENCTAKHKATIQWFKPTVRIFKNMRTKLVDDGKIARDTAPSYYVEGMLWNVPKEMYGTSYQDTVFKCLKWIVEADRTKLVCANRQYWLLGNSNVQWTVAKCDAFLSAAVKLWDGW